jgi:EAL domain-containing protein (putative c-di-GMP-specific phosphodiesterase class I)
MNGNGPRGQFLRKANEPAMRDLAQLLEGLIAGTIQFEMHAQAVVDLRRGIVAGYEALSRFTGSIDLGPDRVLAIAGALGKRLELEAIMARKALELRGGLPPNCFLSVNVSPELLLSAHWRKIQSDFKPFAATCFEITEQEAISDYNAIRLHVERIRKSGGCVAVDDTGSGYASLKHVMELRPDFIKLDRLFVNSCHLEAAKRALIELLGDTADRLNAWIVAEGVENQSELDELLRLQVPLAQGWFLARPQSEMLPLEPEKGAYIRSRTAEFDHSRSVFQFTDMCPSTHTEEEARLLLQDQDMLSAVILVDDWDRPIGMLERNHLVGVRRLDSLMRVQVASSPEEVLRRPPVQGHDPIAAIDDDGKLQGVIFVERLVRGLLDERARAEGEVIASPQWYAPDRLHVQTPKRIS